MMNSNKLSGLLWRNLERLILSPGGHTGLSILIFHRVLPEKDPLRPSIPTVDEFDALVGYLTQRFNIKPLKRAFHDVQHGKRVSHSLAITFDDGYADNVEHAYPVLKKYSAPATYFIASGMLNKGIMWNDSVIEAIRRFPGGNLELQDIGLGVYQISDLASRRAAIKALIPQLKYRLREERVELIAQIEERTGNHMGGGLMMSDDQLLRLAKDPGTTIGGHTISHPILRNLSDDEAEREIFEGKERLEEILSRQISCFAYPNGVPNKDFAIRDRALVKKAGYELAVSTSPGGVHSDSDAFQLPRFTPWDNNRFVFGLRLLHTSRNRGVRCS